MRKRYKVLFLIFAVVGVYYPAIFAGYNLVDDVEALGRLDDAVGFSIIGKFLAGAGGEYYRPLTTLTFYVDKLLWALEPSFMHLENIILHAANVLLVFLIASRIFSDDSSRKFELPFMCSLLFALHPINSEAVNWISGRHDLLATTFVLGSTLLIQKGVETQNYKFLILSSLSLFMGCLAKETALFFFPVTIFLSYSLSVERTPISSGQNTASITLGKTTFPFAAGLISYLLLRMQGVKSGESPIVLVAGQIVQVAAHSLMDTLRIVFKLFGFYVKKLFIPVPMNFAIVSVDNFYVWVGVVALLVSFYLLVRRNRPADFLLIGFFLISSGIAVAFSGISWTPVAERYLYLSSAFFSIGVIGIAFSLLERYHKQAWVVASMLPVLALSAYATAERSLVWQSNLSLYQDTVRKSPGFKKLQNEIAAAMKEQGQVEEADRLLDKAKSENPSHVFLYINQADLRLGQGRPEEARKILIASIQNKRTANPEALKMLARIDEQRLFEARSRSEQIAIAQKIIDTHDHIYSKTHDPFCLYRAGQLLLFAGERQRAGEYFRCAYEAAPDGAYFKAPAKKLAERLARDGK